MEFPEIVDDGEYQRKEEIFSKSLPRAQAVITNAKIIKQRLIKYYNISEKRITPSGLNSRNGCIDISYERSGFSDLSRKLG